MAVMTPRGARPRLIEFDASEASDTALDVSPDGKAILFDLLGHIYRLPIKGGKAEPLTQGSGVALNMHPRFSPDGRMISFISDRSGQLNVWVMKADGSRPRAVTQEREARFFDPAWTADGKSLIAVRKTPWTGYGWDRRTAELWALPLDGSAPRPLARHDRYQYNAPSPAPDGKTLYLQSSFLPFDKAGVTQEADYRLQALDLASGRMGQVRSHPLMAPRSEVSVPGMSLYLEDLSKTGLPAEVAPRVSPNGRYLAFAVRMRDEPQSFRGHRYYASTALFVRDLQSGKERRLASRIVYDNTDGHSGFIEKLPPSFAWTPDNKSIVYLAGGGIHKVDIETAKSVKIPFVAHVRRIISESVRGQIQIDDHTLQPKLLQWPSSSPDGRKLVFVAAGQIWLTDLEGGTPKPLVPAAAGVIQNSPAWSPDGSAILYTSWSAAERGAVWRYDVASGQSRRVTSEINEYVDPVWSADGATMMFLAGPSETAGVKPDVLDSESFLAPPQWQILMQRGDAPPFKIAQTSLAQVPSFGMDDSVAYMDFSRSELVEEMGKAWSRPKPDDAVVVRSVTLNGPSSVVLLIPPRNIPPSLQVSPDRRWVAYDIGQKIFVQRLPVPLDTGSGWMTIDPDVDIAGRVRVDLTGGSFFRWRDATTLEFFEGNRFVRYDAARATRLEVPIALSLHRAVPTGRLALRGAKIITSERDLVIPKGDVIIDGARLVCVGLCDGWTVDRTIDVTGKVIMPGMIDTHDHSTSFANDLPTLDHAASRATLAYGVTTRIDPAGSTVSLSLLSDLIESGRMIGPRSFGAGQPINGPVTARGGGATYYPQLLSLETSQAAQYEADRRIALGVVTLKLYNLGARQRYQRMMDAARHRNVTVTAEGKATLEDLAMAFDGLTGFEHAIPAFPLYSDISTFLGKAGTVYSAPLIVESPGIGSAPYFRQRADLRTDRKYTHFFPRSVIENSLLTNPPGTNVGLMDIAAPILAEGVADVSRAGGYATLGGHSEQQGVGAHWGLWSLAMVMTPLQAIKAATINGAYFIGLDRETGSLKPGKLADLIVLDADPLIDIRNSLTIVYVMKNGNLFEGESLKSAWTHDDH